MSKNFARSECSRNNYNLDWVNAMDDSQKSDIALLEGEIASKDSPFNELSGQTFDTLDEPIRTTLLRDLKSILSKVRHILFPASPNDAQKYVLKDWDLWGPLLLCTFLALFLHHDTHIDNVNRIGPHFAEIFILIWLGSYIISLNYKLLALSPGRRRRVGSSLSYVCPSIFQLLCVFGYCLSPPCAGLILLTLIKLVIDESALFYVKLVVGLLIGFLWPTVSCFKILSKYQEKEKMPLCVYPIGLFYFFLSWVIMTSH